MNYYIKQHANTNTCKYVDLDRCVDKIMMKNQNVINVSNMMYV